MPHHLPKKARVIFLLLIKPVTMYTTDDDDFSLPCPIVPGPRVYRLIFRVNIPWSTGMDTIDILTFTSYVFRLEIWWRCFLRPNLHLWPKTSKGGQI